MIPWVKKVQRSQKQVKIAEFWLIILPQGKLATVHQTQTLFSSYSFSFIK